MSGFQSHLDGAERQSGITPLGFLEAAEESGMETAGAGEVLTWLKETYGLDHGHAANLAQLITTGPEAVAAKYNDGEPLRLDGVPA